MRKIAIAAAVSLSLSGMSGVSHALGLGEIEMYSALNQTLDAEIEILSVTDDELLNLRVGLAPASAFARAGLEQSALVSSIAFTVDRRPDGKAVVKVTNDSPVLEPFLNFLIEVDAPGSVKLIREYTVLLSPPSLVAEQPLLTRTSPAAASDQGALFASNPTDVSTSSATGTGGVPIDLDGLAGSNSATGNESAAEVTFTVTSNTVTVPASDASGVDTGFVPDAVVLTAQADTNTADDNAIFGNEFESDQGGDLIPADELRGLVSDGGDDTNFDSGFDADAQGQGGAGNLIDLSGILGDSDTGISSAATENRATENRATESVAVGVDVQVDDIGRPSTPDFSNFDVSGNTYRIRSQDTLWRIANGQKASGVTAHQMMVALLETNPNAFIGGNMNRLRSGEVLQIPSASAQQSMTRVDASAIVESWTRNNRPPTSFTTNSTANIAPPSVELSQNLDDVNQRYDEVRTEIASGTLERDQLQGRVENLTDNMEEMKGLITVRENELNQLQDEVAAAESNAAAIDAQISQLSDASANASAVQQGLTGELAEAQRAVEQQADTDRNRATAEAEAQAVRLATEEDALRSQLAALDLEKRDLEASAQSDRAALVREAEAEKNRLLAQARTEREAIMAELEADKERISSEAELEIIRLRAEAEVDNQRVLQQAQEDRVRVAAEAQEMQEELLRMEAEKANLMEEANNSNASISSVADSATDESARMQKDGSDKMTDAKAGMADTMAEKSDTDAEGKGILGGMAETSKSMADTGKSMAAGGAAAVGGLLGAAPLQETLGNRKTLLAAGAGISLVGLLAAWGLRRRKKTVVPKEVISNGGLQPRSDARPVPTERARSRHEQEERMYGDTENAPGPQKNSGNNAAAAAAAAAAAVTGTAAVAANRKDASAGAPVAPAAEPPLERSASVTAPTSQAPLTAAPAPASVPSNPVTASPAVADKTSATPAAPKAAGTAGSGSGAVDAELEETALDDTITEAEVYLRYGLHGQAEDLLKTAIERSPSNEEYHFKLLENYHDQKNSADFAKESAKFKEKFPKSGHMSCIADMESELGGGGSDSSSSSGSGSGSATGGILGVAGAAAAGAAAVATGAAGSAKDAAADGIGALKGSDTDIGSESSDDLNSDLLDQTIDPGSEFSVDELQATGNLGAYADDATDFGDQGGLSLDDVDLASLDDDGTMNLEEIAGNQMSGSDLGTLDLTNPGMDNSLGDLSLDDTDLSSLDDIKGGFKNSVDNDMSREAPIAGGTDEMETMLDLAKAYIDMGDDANASKALKDIAARGNPLQQTEAAEILKKLK